jgi:hypothetical protein
LSSDIESLFNLWMGYLVEVTDTRMVNVALQPVRNCRFCFCATKKN